MPLVKGTRPVDSHHQSLYLQILLSQYSPPCPSIYPSIFHLPTHPSPPSSIHPCTFLVIYSSTYISTHISLHSFPFIHHPPYPFTPSITSIHYSIHPPTHLPIFPVIYSFVLCICLSISCPSIHPSIH